jgi:hypothetical protein
VVSRTNPRQVVGYFGRSSVFLSLRKNIEQERRVDPGWLPWGHVHQPGGAEPLTQQDKEQPPPPAPAL